ncbi:MAG: hypothetical protein NVS4B9_21980 [Ktedonobacteraceae bacterium]
MLFALFVIISLVLFIAHFRTGIEKWLILLEQRFKEIASIHFHRIKHFDYDGILTLWVALHLCS